MPGPLLPLLAPLAPALLIYAGLRRWPRAAAACGAASTLFIAILIAAMELQAPVTGAALFSGDQLQFLGSALLLTEGIRRILLLVYGAGALLFLLSGVWPQGPEFVAAGLASLAPLSFALMVTPLSFGVVALLLASAFLTALIQGQRAGSTLAPLRYLLLTALALPVFLVAGWMLDSQQLALGGALWRLLFLGATLLLAGFPFHIWVRPLANEARPLTAVFVLAPVQLIILTFVWRWFQQNPNLLPSTQLDAYLGWSGAVTALLAALMAFNERDPRRLLGALVLADMGATLICLGQGVAGIEQAWALLFLRFIGLLIAAVGLQVAGRDPDLSEKQPLAAVLFAYGALSLVGLPLTPGFTARWAAVSLAGGASFWWALALLLAAGAGVAGTLQVVAPLLRGVRRDMDLVTDLFTSRTLLLRAALITAALLALLISVFPWPLLNIVSPLNELF